jgi:hypothetical protein
MDQQFTVTVTAYCLELKIHINNVTMLKTYIRFLKIFLKKYHLLKYAVILNTETYCTNADTSRTLRTILQKDLTIKPTGLRVFDIVIIYSRFLPLF